MVVPWSKIPARKWAKVGKPIAAHEFCKRLPGDENHFYLDPELLNNKIKHLRFCYSRVPHAAMRLPI